MLQFVWIVNALLTVCRWTLLSDKHSCLWRRTQTVIECGCICIGKLVFYNSALFSLDLLFLNQSIRISMTAASDRRVVGGAEQGGDGLTGGRKISSAGCDTDQNVFMYF